MAVVELLNPRRQLVMHLLSCLAAYFSFYATHVPGVQNTAADALLRNMLLFTLGPTGTHSLSNIGSANSQQASLDKLVHTIFDRGIAPATRAVYDSGWQQYIKLCNQYGITPLPANEASQAAFTAHLS